MRVWVDTNVLLRSAQPAHPLYLEGSQSIARLLEQRHRLYSCPQNIVEFWSAATRPVAVNGLGLTQQQVLLEITSIEKSLTLLPDAHRIYQTWTGIVADHQVLGSKVHDARLATVMIVYGIEHILTFNAPAFRRFPNINVLLPSAVVS
jgi:predicted nucleic acid-binding protein